MNSNNDNIRISAIAAMAENRVIGKDGGMCWHIPGDLKHFKQTTMGHPLVMGRKSYESLGKPLPGRTNIIVSRSMKDIPQSQPATEIYRTMEAAAHDINAEKAPDRPPMLFAELDQAITAAKDIARQDNIDEIFIAGGGEIYKAALPVTDRIYLTIIHRDYEGDAFFPEFDKAQWRETASEYHENDPSYTILTLDRV